MTTNDPLTDQHHATIHRAVRRDVKKVIAIFVLPAYLISGGGTVWAFFKFAHDTDRRQWEQCVNAVQARANFRDVADTFQDEIDEILNLVQQPPPELVEIPRRARAKLETNFAPRSLTECGREP
jgi:hypothetical protein